MIKISSKVPIGQQLRDKKRKNADAELDLPGRTKLKSLDEQIAELEAKDDSESDSETESTGSSKAIIDEDGCIVEKDESGEVVRLVSTLANEKIQPLPKNKLPSERCYFSNSAAKTDSKVTFQDNSMDSGLSKAVKEVLKSYEPSSHEKKPFWCRLCKHQAENMEKFEKHKMSKFHLTAERMERKMTFCKICKKQFNSLDQYNNHCKGKWHRQRQERYSSYSTTQYS